MPMAARARAASPHFVEKCSMRWMPDTKCIVFNSKRFAQPRVISVQLHDENDNHINFLPVHSTTTIIYSPLMLVGHPRPHSILLMFNVVHHHHHCSSILILMFHDKCHEISSKLQTHTHKYHGVCRIYYAEERPGYIAQTFLNNRSILKRAATQHTHTQSTI